MWCYRAVLDVVLEFRISFPREIGFPLRRNPTDYSPDSCKKHARIKKGATAYCHNSLIIKSGRQDSNLRPPAPKAGTLTGLRYTPNV